MSPDGGQQSCQNRDDEIDDRLPDLFLIIVHNSIELICLLLRTTDFTDFTDSEPMAIINFITHFSDSLRKAALLSSAILPATFPCFDTCVACRSEIRVIREICGQKESFVEFV